MSLLSLLSSQHLVYNPHSVSFVITTWAQSIPIDDHDTYDHDDGASSLYVMVELPLHTSTSVNVHKNMSQHETPNKYAMRYKQANSPSLIVTITTPISTHTRTHTQMCHIDHENLELEFS